MMGVQPHQSWIRGKEQTKCDFVSASGILLIISVTGKKRVYEFFFVTKIFKFFIFNFFRVLEFSFFLSTQYILLTTLEDDRSCQRSTYEWFA